MKTKLFALYLLFFGIIGYGQVTTKIIEVDLSEPHVNSIRICTDLSCTTSDKCSRKWLSIKHKEMVSIKLKNVNSLRYTYKIDTKNISFYNKEAQVNEGFVKVILDTKELEKKAPLSLNESLTIDDIIELNKTLNSDIAQLDSDVDFLYETLKQKIVLEEKDYFEKRVLFLDKAKIICVDNNILIKNLEKFKYSTKKYSIKYEMAKKNLNETKEEIEKIIKAIIQKFYTIDLNIYTLPIDVQGKNIDVLEFKLRRFDRETKDEDLGFASTPYNIWIKGGLKIDVSAGIFFTSLYDEEYDKRDDPATAGNKIIMLKNSGDYDMAFGSTINTYVRMNSWIVPTFNFGAVITQNEKLQILLGLGAILGKQERIIFSAGISMGKVNRIADGYQVGSSYNLGDSGTIPTQSQFKFGKFFGITYNLSKVKKISPDKGIEQE